MRYYEIWFYYYGEKDERTDYDKEFTVYLKSDKRMASTEELLDVLNDKMYRNSDNEDVMNFKNLLEGHLENLSNWFEISHKDFVQGCGLE